MRSAAALLVLLASPAAARAQDAAPPTEVTVRSRPEVRVDRGGRFGLTFSLGVGFERVGVHRAADRVVGAVDLGLAGAASVGSLRATLSLLPWLALQVGGAGALAIAPSLSASGAARTPSLENVAGFGLLGGGVVLGARAAGWQVSLLGGAAWTLANFGGNQSTRTGPGTGGGVFVEAAHLWRVAPAWTVGFGATLWGLFGRDDGPWLYGAAPAWNNLGGALLATVSTR